jgi:hypothetical protein
MRPKIDPPWAKDVPRENAEKQTGGVMGTKNNPGPYDCLAKAEDDEPIFVLLARDPIGAEMVALWSMLNQQKFAHAVVLLAAMCKRCLFSGPAKPEKTANADVVSIDMAVWRQNKTGLTTALDDDLWRR